MTPGRVCLLVTQSLAGWWEIATHLFKLQQGVVEAADVLVHDRTAAKLLMEVGEGHLRHGAPSQRQEGVLLAAVARLHLCVDVLHHPCQPAGGAHAGACVLPYGLQQPGILGLGAVLWQKRQGWAEY